MANEDWKPTARLRFVRHSLSKDEAQIVAVYGMVPHEPTVLQQWYAPDVPSYMRTQSDGEWRDVVVEEEMAP